MVPTGRTVVFACLAYCSLEYLDHKIRLFVSRRPVGAVQGRVQDVREGDGGRACRDVLLLVRLLLLRSCAVSALVQIPICLKRRLSGGVISKGILTNCYVVSGVLMWCLYWNGLGRPKR